MRHSSPKQREKLVPLRKFSSPKGYSSLYLSQLVQRKKLKAKRIGRNYYTCEEWFNEYLDRHARDEKHAVYEKNRIKQNELTLNGQNIAIDTDKSQGVNFFIVDKGKQRKITTIKASKLKIAAITAAFVVLVLSNMWYINNLNNKGQVAGALEQQATSTEELINN